MRFLSAIILMFATSSSLAGWTLDPSRSELSFVATKDAHVADNHYFLDFSASVNDKGKAELIIKTASVETNIDMRDKRLRSILFNVDEFPEARVTLMVRTGLVKQRPAGTMKAADVSGMLDLVGVQQLITGRVTIYHLADGSMVVDSADTVLVDTEDFGLLPAINQLREMAGLNSISVKVPVSFRLVFTRDQE